MAVVTATFACGHVVALTGDEQRPRCHCGNDQLQGIVAAPPRFRGHALGPCAVFEDLPAKAVVLKADKD